MLPIILPTPPPPLCTNPPPHLLTYPLHHGDNPVPILGMVSEGIPHQVQLPQIWSAVKHIRQTLQSRQTKVTRHTTSQCTASHTHTHTSSSDLLAPKGVGQGPGSSLGPVTKAERLSNGWAGQAHARQPWGEWLLGTLAVKMAVRRARWTAR